MDPGMQGLHPTVEHLRHARDLADVLDRQVGVAERLSRSASGDQLPAEGVKLFGEIDDSSLIRDGEEGSRQGSLGVEEKLAS